MAEYTNVPAQTVLAGQNVLFSETPIPCNKGLVLHREGSGLFTLRGPGCASNQCYARYYVLFQANIAVAAGGAAANGAAVAIAQNGEALASSIATVTPAALAEFNHVSTFAYIDVPRGCCATVSVEAAGTEGIDVQNAAIAFTRVA